MNTHPTPPSPQMGPTEVSPPLTAVPRWKRPLDWAVILATIPIWLPVALGCGAWIFLVSRGRILFRQERVGRGGKIFTMVKFRTMIPGADTRVHDQHVRRLIERNEPMTKLDPGDGRLIPGALFLRATGLDELPQLLNVMRGEMSIVGPRPCTPAEMERFKPCYRKRFQGLPGLTGSWQVNGKNRTTFRKMIALDICYLRNASVDRDLQIIIRTVPALLGELRDLRKNREQRVPDSPTAIPSAQVAARRDATQIIYRA